MKRIYVIIILCITLVFSSCGKWLEVRPQTEIRKDEMFATQNGFRDALIGAYIRLKQGGLYGGEMMWGTMEYFAQNWEYTTDSQGENLSGYNHEATEDALGSIFNNEYKVISDLNSFLPLMDEKIAIFDNGYYDLIKGEALAMRALCHFDVLRLFGPMPTQANNNTNKILPYVKNVSRFANDYVSYKEFTDLLFNDLDSAEMHLSKIDPVLGKLEIDGFYKNRKVRMSYYCVLAQKARLYHWMGNNEKAVEYARKVIHAELDGKKLYKLGTFADVNISDYSFSNEHIFSLHVFDLENKAEQAFGSEAKYSQRQNQITDELYDSWSSDIRKELWTTVTSVVNPNKSQYVIKKYWQEKKKDSDKTPCLIPLIRLSEMYFIVIESSSDYAEVNQLYSEFCMTRKIPIPEITSDLQRKILMQSEYHKEFYAEGQTFFAYKRMAVSNIMWHYEPMTQKQYVIPLPKREIDYTK